VFDETLRFHMALNSLESRTLWLTVWHSDMFGRNDFLGEVMMGLQDKVFDNPQPQWYILQERVSDRYVRLKFINTMFLFFFRFQSEPFDDLPAYKGDIIVGLKFIPPDSHTASSSSYQQSVSGGSLRKIVSKPSFMTRNTTKGSLHVLVKEAKNLSPVKASGTCDAFCKRYVQHLLFT
jgi:synaptotagmin-like protein